MSQRIAITIVAAAGLGLLTFALTAPSGSPAVAAGADGAAVYASNCSACHGAKGQGTAGTVPPLAKNAYVNGDPKKVIHTLLSGMSGAIKVNGTTYDGGMPPWKGVLTNAQISAVLTYVRSSWGNKAPAVTEKQVASSK
jgi:mono/diheme cytochrome c family protein